MATLTVNQLILMAGLLISGSINTLCRKAQYDSVDVCMDIRTYFQILKFELTVFISDNYRKRLKFLRRSDRENEGYRDLESVYTLKLRHFMNRDPTKDFKHYSHFHLRYTSTFKLFAFKAKGYKSEEHSFNHPWFQTWMLCSAQTLCLIGLPIQRRREKQEFKHSEKKQRPAEIPFSVNINDKSAKNDTKDSQTETEHTEPIVEIEIGQPVSARLCQWILVIPACVHVTSAALSGISLLYVDASVMLMLKGSVIIFAGIFSQLFLKKKLKLTHWFGIIIVISGLVLTGCSSVLKNQDYKTVGGKTITGIILILCAQVINGGKVVLEEALIKKRNLHPLHVVGMTGLYGFTMMSFVVLPILYFIPADNVHGFHEDSIDALYQISNNIQLLILCILYVASVAFCNFFAMAVMKSLTAIHRTLIDACRAVVVWVVGIIIFYGFDKNFGETFDKSYGILQIIGLFGIVLGTAVYNQLIDLPKCVPCLQATEKKDDQNETSRCDNKRDTTNRENHMEISKF